MGESAIFFSKYLYRFLEFYSEKGNIHWGREVIVSSPKLEALVILSE